MDFNSAYIHVLTTARDTEMRSLHPSAAHRADAPRRFKLRRRRRSSSR